MKICKGRGRIEHAKVLRVGTFALGCLAMELQAVIAAIRRAPTHSSVTIYSVRLTVVDVVARGNIKCCGSIKAEWETLLT